MWYFKVFLCATRSFRPVLAWLWLVVPLVGCANYPMAPLTTQLMTAEQLAGRFILDSQWWKIYEDPDLDRLMAMALQRNINLARTAVTINKALYRAKLLGADLVPSFSADSTGSGTRQLDSGTVGHAFQSQLGVSYELDLWLRLRNAATAQEWEYKATIEDRESTRLTLISTVTDTFFELRYLMQAIEVTQSSIDRYTQLLALTRIRYNLGKVALVEPLQAEQALLSAQNNLVSFQTQQAVAQQTLRDLVNLGPDEVRVMAGNPAEASTKNELENGAENETKKLVPQGLGEAGESTGKAGKIGQASRETGQTGQTDKTDKTGQTDQVGHAAQNQLGITFRGDLLAAKTAPVNLAVPVAALVARPDISASESRLQSAFKNRQSVEASWYPTVTVGSTLGASSDQAITSFDVPFLSGSVKITFPLLQWNTLRWNIKIAEADFETARLTFVETVTTALNEVSAAYATSANAHITLRNTLEKNDKDARISAYYKSRYELGAAELKDYLDALNTEDASLLAALNAKYVLIRNENLVYKAMGGRYNSVNNK